ncbi:NAD-dependent epimerase/dehydratase family protein [Parachryseolinea silvisoli]|uniref:NAD-dependent epimerase/dehydratase family protein n=1 Tax=Parachryseolinea silvisoli TaxID=2873601 RepID=UPI002265EB75|nr:NAD-dependent epimerase/dehydratase family protein [Parachryseolinea silvisoli]MCD9014255.1 NAD-dependent epimerase/dehydratase family protein [Parachryseolinea silvisoli]
MPTGTKKILILGGLGFIGKNLYNRLVQDGHAVTILTERIHDESDGFLTSAIRQHIVQGSILNPQLMNNIVVGFDVIFSLAGSSGAADSIRDPYHDLDTNLKGHLNILEACRQYNPGALLVFPSSRLVYGKPQGNPVDERHPLQPESIYAIHKITTEQYYQVYQRLHGVRCVIFRIANPFGPYQRFGSNNYGILNWFIHKALVGEPIEIYGDGSQQRDFIYINDLVDVLTRAMDTPAMAGNIYNLGAGTGISLRQAVEVIQRYIPATQVTFRPWPEIARKIETGDYIADIGFLKYHIGSVPGTSFDAAMKETIAFYDRSNK